MKRQTSLRGHFFFRYYPPIICCLGVRGVESLHNFFMSSLCPLKEIPALRSLEMSNAYAREFLFRYYPPLKKSIKQILH